MNRVCAVAVDTGTGARLRSSWPARSLILVLAVVLTVILSLLSGPVASASAVTATASGTVSATTDTTPRPSFPAAETRVAASTIGLASFVGPGGDIAAGQRRDNVLPQPGFVSATSVAAEGALTTPRVGSAKLQNIIDDLYKGTTNPGRVGTGTTADAIRYELRTGEQVFGRSHIQKGEDYVRGIENWLKRNPDAAFYDRLVGRSVADDLLDALGRSG